MQRIFNISKWTRIPSGSALEFKGDRPRKVVLELNTPGTAIMSLIEGARSDFLARVEGRDTVEFYVTGPFSVTSSGSDCYVYTADGSGVEIRSLDSESFAVIRERRPRNPELEYIAAMMAENVNRRLAQQAEELRRDFARREVSSRALSSPSRDGGGSPELEGDGVESEASAGDGGNDAPGGRRPRGRPRGSGSSGS